MSCTSPLFRSTALVKFPPDVASRQRYGAVIVGREEMDALNCARWTEPRDWMPIPCGKCIQCRLSYSRQWAFRCLEEVKKMEKEGRKSFFLTLTIDDDHLKKITTVDRFSGAICKDVAVLDKRDLTLFWKRARKVYGHFRYMACGEYGDRSFRPHYHAICFGLALDDLVFYKYDFATGSSLYMSPKLSAIWEKGNVIVGAATWESCAYVARYVTKKLNGAPNVKYFTNCLQLGLEPMQPEYIVMSRRPGIGAGADTVNYDIDSEIFHRPGSPAYSGQPLRYFDRQLEKSDPARLEKIKEKRRFLCRIRSRSLNFSSDEVDRLADLDRRSKKTLKLLRRSYS